MTCGPLDILSKIVCLVGCYYLAYRPLSRSPSAGSPEYVIALFCVLCCMCSNLASTTNCSYQNITTIMGGHKETYEKKRSCGATQ